MHDAAVVTHHHPLPVGEHRQAGQASGLLARRDHAPGCARGEVEDPQSVVGPEGDHRGAVGGVDRAKAVLEGHAVFLGDEPRVGDPRAHPRAQEQLATVGGDAHGGVVDALAERAEVEAAPLSQGDIFYGELQRAESRFGTTGFVGLRYFVNRWKSDALPPLPDLRMKILDQLVAVGAVEVYDAPNGDQALRTLPGFLDRREDEPEAADED